MHSPSDVIAKAETAPSRTRRNISHRAPCCGNCCARPTEAKQRTWHTCIYSGMHPTTTSADREQKKNQSASSCSKTSHRMYTTYVVVSTTKAATAKGMHDSSARRLGTAHGAWDTHSVDSLFFYHRHLLSLSSPESSSSPPRRTPPLPPPPPPLPLPPRAPPPRLVLLLLLPPPRPRAPRPLSPWMMSWASSLFCERKMREPPKN